MKVRGSDPGLGEIFFSPVKSLNSYAVGPQFDSQLFLFLISEL